MVMALDAQTGDELWISEDKPYPHVVAAGELDTHNVSDGISCWLVAQGIPLITKNTVYTSSSHHGDLRALKLDQNGNVEKVSTFETKHAFLNSPSIAPGMLVV